MKTHIKVFDKRLQKCHTISWYKGTTDSQIERLIRAQTNLTDTLPIALIDQDNDLVPISTTLPNDHHFHLTVLQNVGHRAVFSPDHTPVTETRKRKRVAYTLTRCPSALDSLPPCSVLIQNFVSTFTQRIDPNDNINFIPNTGIYSLYSLYTVLLREFIQPLKSQTVFYQIATMKGSLDRQRVIRYYQARNNVNERVHIFRPSGKGVFLQMYAPYQKVKHVNDLRKMASVFVTVGIDPNQMVGRYIEYVQCFRPISKKLYQTLNK